MTTETKQTIKDQRDNTKKTYSELRKRIDDVGGNIGRLADDNTMAPRTDPRANPGIRKTRLVNSIYTQYSSMFP